MNRLVRCGSLVVLATILGGCGDSASEQAAPKDLTPGKPLTDPSIAPGPILFPGKSKPAPKVVTPAPAPAPAK
jgi:hypothetical protein